MLAVNSRVPFWIVAAVCAAGLWVAAVRPRAAGCDPAGNVHFICDQLAPEDLVLVPGGEWRSFGQDAGFFTSLSFTAPSCAMSAQRSTAP